MAERKSFWQRPGLALIAASILVTPIVAGCGGPSDRSASNLPPVDDTRGGYAGGYNTAEQPTKKGLSTGQKVAILAGAAALYYMYKKNKEKRAAGVTSEPQYYLSKNGRVYYRDQTGRAHWVTAPPGGIQVPLNEAQQYAQFQGYNNRTDGRDLMGLGIE
jgi:hypothetical protein